MEGIHVVWVILTLVAVVFALPALLMAIRYRTRHVSGVVVGAERRLDPLRSTLALTVATLALVAGIAALVDQTIEFRPGEGLLLLVGAASAGAVGLYPARGIWTEPRRLAAAIVAALWAATGFLTLPFAVAATACGCSSTLPGYLPPVPLGIEVRGWISLAVIAGPVLLLLAASRLPDKASARPNM
jgi:hypothetical protein